MKIIYNLLRLISIILLLIFTATNFSCTNEPANIELLDTVCFETQVHLVLQSSCGISGCHDPGTREAGFSTESYETIKAMVMPGSPRDSKIYNAITNVNSVEGFMPPSPYEALNNEQRTAIMVWIEQGAMNTTCTSDSLPVNPIDTTEFVVDSVSFVQDIWPIFALNCAISNCHDAKTHKEDYILDNYPNITSRPNSIIPFNAAESKLFQVVIENDPDDRMPYQMAPLTSSQIALLQQWINEGALNSDYPDPTCDTANVTFSGSVNPIIQSKCINCHRTASISNKYIKLTEIGDVKAANASIMSIIKNPDPNYRMPKGLPKLDDCSIRIIEIWIDKGMLTN